MNFHFQNLITDLDKVYSTLRDSNGRNFSLENGVTQIENCSSNIESTDYL